MKNLLVILIITLLGHSVNAQIYFPKGASWIFHQQSFISSSFSYTTIESKGDSIINGDTLTFLEGFVNCSSGTNEFVKQVGSKIYKLNKCDNSYSLLYDFGAAVGDTLIIYPDICQFNDTLLLRVDSIVPITINVSVLKRFYLTQINLSTGIYFDGSIIEGIGNTTSFYPLLGFCDPIGGPLRCYQDSIIGEYNAGLYGGVCDTIFVGIDEHHVSEISLYPNPTTGEISIDLGKIHQGLIASITNNVGQVVSTHQFESTDFINLNIEAPKGIYFLTIASVGGETKTMKIIKL